MGKIKADRLRLWNQSYDYNHGICENDIEEVEKSRQFIHEKHRECHEPQVGDRVSGVYWGTYPYSNGLIASVKDGVVEVCFQPYVPFLSKYAMEKGRIGLSVSGGPFTHAAKCRFELEEEHTTGLFCQWGRCGACANGAVTFPATVRKWRLTEIQIFGDTRFTTDSDYEFKGTKYVESATTHPREYIKGDIFQGKLKDGTIVDIRHDGWSVKTSVEAFEHDYENGEGGKSA